MTVARRVGEGIAGEKITYSFGRVTITPVGSGFRASLGNNGRAYITSIWRKRGADDKFTVAGDFDELDARSANGMCERRPTEHGQQQVGRHREITGILRGRATVTVTTPRFNVEHLGGGEP